ncbi:hypothetical protein H7Q97_13080 [Ochrobactrum sp. CM-21-5]|nr:hypothetical protein [Ochrobactrum sp. CM-21-5]MBC2886325.1 hypothetical protein [Ochrobactrum sp. CM-21-5]
MRELTLEEMMAVSGGGGLDSPGRSDANYGGGRGSTGSRGGATNGPGSDGDRVNRADKRNRDGTKDSWASTFGHITGQISSEIGVSFGAGGPSVSGKLNCGSCHDPYAGRGGRGGGNMGGRERGGGDSGGRGGG